MDWETDSDDSDYDLFENAILYSTLAVASITVLWIIKRGPRRGKIGHPMQPFGRLKTLITTTTTTIGEKVKNHAIMGPFQG